MHDFGKSYSTLCIYDLNPSITLNLKMHIKNKDANFTHCRVRTACCSYTDHIHFATRCLRYWKF